MKLNKIQLARVIGYLERIHALNLHESQIEDIDNIINIPEPEVEKVPPTSAESVNDLLAAIQGEKKIEAIKAYRVLTLLGLKESKDAIEKYWYTRYPRMGEAVVYPSVRDARTFKRALLDDLDAFGSSEGLDDNMRGKIYTFINAQSIYHKD